MNDVAREIGADWRRTGLRGGFLARELTTGEEIAVNPAQPIPLASVVKVPIALVVLDAFARGVLDPGHEVVLDPATRTPGPTGLSLFGHRSVVALDDLVGLALAISDNAATDALLEHIPPAEVTARLRSWGCPDIVVRHPIRALYDAMAELADAGAGLAMELSVLAATRGGGHAIPQLDVSRANSGSARAIVDLLARIWQDSVSEPSVTAALRARMSHQLSRHRMGAELVSDATRLSSKTGTFLNLRHEAGVHTTASGQRVALAALTISSVPAFEQPEADWAIGRAARLAVEALTA